MAISAILAVIGSIVAGIWSGIQYVSARAFELAKEALDMLKKGFDWFMQTAPAPVKVLFFLFIVLIIADTVVGFFIGLNYVCTTDEQLRSPQGFLGGVGMYFEGVFQDFENSTTDYDNWVLQNTLPAKQYSGSDEKSILYVKCFDDNPKLTFFGLDFLNYRYWVILVLIGLLWRFAKGFGLL